MRGGSGADFGSCRFLVIALIDRLCFRRRLVSASKSATQRKTIKPVPIPIIIGRVVEFVFFIISLDGFVPLVMTAVIVNGICGGNGNCDCGNKVILVISSPVVT
jgi:hypothetical protein